MNRYIIFLLFILRIIFCQDLKKEIAKCASIEGELERLDCYDELARKNNIFGQQIIPTSLSGIGMWDVTKSINPIDDSETVKLFLYAESGENYLGEKAYLVIRCKSSEIEVYIGWNDYLGSDLSMVTTRVGQSKAEKNSWSNSTDNQSTFAPSPIELIQSMLGNKTFVAQVTPYNENPVTAIFDISGIENAVKPLIDSCGELETYDWTTIYDNNDFSAEYRKRMQKGSMPIQIRITNKILYSSPIVALQVNLLKNGEIVQKEYFTKELSGRYENLTFVPGFSYDQVGIEYIEIKPSKGKNWYESFFKPNGVYNQKRINCAMGCMMMLLFL